MVDHRRVLCFKRQKPYHCQREKERERENQLKELGCVFWQYFSIDVSVRVEVAVILLS